MNYIICSSFTPEGSNGRVIPTVQIQETKKKKNPHKIRSSRRTRPLYPPSKHYPRASSPSLVLASKQQRYVKENPKQEPPRHGDPQAIPLAQICNPLLQQYVGPSSQACGASDLRSQCIAH